MTGGVEDPGVKFAEVLTTASAVANYLANPLVTAEHVISAIRILREEMTMEDLGRALSPLVPRPPGGGAEPAVRDFARRWFAALGGDPHASLTNDQLDAMLTELGEQRAATGE